MANGVYTNFGIDSTADDVVDSVVSGGPFSLTKTGDAPDGDTTPDVLSPGDSFTISGQPDAFVYGGSDGAGGILAFNTGTGESIWLSDSTITIGDSFPAFVNMDTTICFLPGTLIATPSGEAAVETLAIGDLVLTADGRAVPVRWLGRQTIVPIFGLPENRSPVLISAGALGEGLPRRDLRVTSGHAMVLDGVLVQAGALVNGTTILRIPRAELGERFTVFHIETEAHEIILAEGAPTETFVDNTTRARFDNYAEYVALFGSEQPMQERPEPRATSARQVPRAIRARIATAAAVPRSA